VATPREIFMSALFRRRTQRPATGSATSVVTRDLMETVDAHFPEAHLEAQEMVRLAEAGFTEIGFDNVMPLFSVWHESAAMGAEVDWGDDLHMPDSRRPLYRMGDDIAIPPDLLKRPGCAVPLKALRLLKERIGGEAAVVGKVFGPWTLSYHMFGVGEFLMNTLLDPPAVKKAIDTLKEVTVLFAHAQIEAGADALCLADHATRDLSSPDAYAEFLAPVHAELHQRIPCPLILHICGDTSDRIPYIRETGIECFHFDSKVPDGDARELAGPALSLMGGTSNFRIVREGSPESIRRDVAEKIAAGIDIIGPECAVPLDAPYRNMRILTDAVKAHACR